MTGSWPKAEQHGVCPTVPTPRPWDSGTVPLRAGTAFGTPMGQRPGNADGGRILGGTRLGTLTIWPLGGAVPGAIRRWDSWAVSRATEAPASRVDHACLVLPAGSAAAYAAGTWRAIARCTTWLDEGRRHYLRNHHPALAGAHISCAWRVCDLRSSRRLQQLEDELAELSAPMGSLG